VRQLRWTRPPSCVRRNAGARPDLARTDDVSLGSAPEPLLGTAPPTLAASPARRRASVPPRRSNRRGGSPNVLRSTPPGHHLVSLTCSRRGVASGKEQNRVEPDETQETNDGRARIHHGQPGPTRRTCFVRPHEGPQAGRVDELQAGAIDVDITVEPFQHREEPRHAGQVELADRSHHGRALPMDPRCERAPAHGLRCFDFGGKSRHQFIQTWKISGQLFDGT